MKTLAAAVPRLPENRRLYGAGRQPVADVLDRPARADATRARRAALVAVVAGVVAAGAAWGLAAERYVGRRPVHGAFIAADEPIGQLHGRVVPVRTEDGVPLHVEIDEADGARPVTVVFCHGLALDQRSWHYQRRDLRDIGRLVFWDQRGHGRSGRGTLEHATIDQLGRDLYDVLRATAPTGPIVLVGHSMGGMTIMALADQHPELFGDRVIGVALVATSPGKLTDFTLGLPAAAGRALRRATPRLLHTMTRRPDLLMHGQRWGDDLLYVITKRYAFVTDQPPSLTRFVASMHENTPLDVVAELYPAFSAHDKLAALDVLNRVETLVVGGEGDVMTPADHSRAIAERVPGAELVILQDAGHMLMLEHHDVLTHHLRALVERALRSSGACRDER
jgi:pimeloyl-ACP methyl ester carboxylesterase